MAISHTRKGLSLRSISLIRTNGRYFYLGDSHASLGMTDLCDNLTHPQGGVSLRSISHTRKGLSLLISHLWLCHNLTHPQGASHLSHEWAILLLGGFHASLGMTDSRDNLTAKHLTDTQCRLTYAYLRNLTCGSATISHTHKGRLTYSHEWAILLFRGFPRFARND